MSFDHFDEHTVFTPMLIFVNSFQVEAKASSKCNRQDSFQVRIGHFCCENSILKYTERFDEDWNWAKLLEIIPAAKKMKDMCDELAWSMPSDDTDPSECWDHYKPSS